MSHYTTKVEQLTAAAGYTTNPLEATPVIIRENELETHRAWIEAKNKTSAKLEELFDKVKVRAKAEIDLAERFGSQTKEDVDKFNQKNLILVQYLSTLQADDFLLNKHKIQFEHNFQEIYTDLKSMVEKARSVNDEIKKLQELQARCDQLRHRAGAN